MVIDEKKDLIISSFQDWRENVNDVIHRLESVTLKEMVISLLVFCECMYKINISFLG